MIWFTADWHLFHRNIIDYCGRPFKDTREMQERILYSYHEYVGADDDVYFLGDLTMEGPGSTEKIARVTTELPGRKHIILGNHDRLKPFAYHDIGFVSVHTALKTTFGTDTEYHLAHDPAWAQTPHTKWICGHVHNHWRHLCTQVNARIINVGVDVWDFAPVAFDAVRELLTQDLVPSCRLPSK